MMIALHSCKCGWGGTDRKDQYIYADDKINALRGLASPDRSARIILWYLDVCVLRVRNNDLCMTSYSTVPELACLPRGLRSYKERQLEWI